MSFSSISDSEASFAGLLAPMAIRADPGAWPDTKLQNQVNDENTNPQMSEADRYNQEKKAANIGKWSPKEDMELKALVLKHGERDWKFIASKMQGSKRNYRQCKSRWNEYLNPVLDFSPFRPDEDALIIKGVNEEGKQWMKITKLLPHRAPHLIKKHWNAKLHKAAEARPKRASNVSPDSQNKRKTPDDELIASAPTPSKLRKITPATQPFEAGARYMSTAPTKPISRDEALERIIKLSSNMPQLEFATQTAFGVSTATIDNPHAILVPALPLEVPTQPHNNVADVVYSTPLEASQSLELEQHPVESSFFLCFDNIPGEPVLAHGPDVSFSDLNCTFSER